MRNAFTRIKNNIEINRSRIGADIERIIMEGVQMPEVGSYDIRADQLTRGGSVARTRSYENQSESERLKTKLVQMFREF